MTSEPQRRDHRRPDDALLVVGAGPGGPFATDTVPEVSSCAATDEIRALA